MIREGSMGNGAGREGKVLSYATGARQRSGLGRLSAVGLTAIGIVQGLFGAFINKVAPTT